MLADELKKEMHRREILNYKEGGRMTKIEKYKDLKDKYFKFKERINLARGLDINGNHDSHNDKALIEFYGNKLWDGDLNMYLHMSYGYYGDSYGYDCCPKMFSEYIIKAANDYKNLILDRALQLYQKDMRKASLDCKDEAESLLKEIEEQEEVER